MLDQNQPPEMARFSGRQCADCTHNTAAVSSLSSLTKLLKQEQDKCCKRRTASRSFKSLHGRTINGVIGHCSAIIIMIFSCY